MLWNQSINHLIEIHREEGSERVIVCTLGRPPGTIITFISCYMPAGNTREQLDEYSRILDEIYELTLKYSVFSTVIWLGDLNGDMERRKPVGRDILLRQFCAEMEYKSAGDPAIPTFHHHNDTSKSRIDHIFKNINNTLELNVEVLTREVTNLSPHDPLVATVSIPTTTKSSTTDGIRQQRLPPKAQWKRINTDKYYESTSLKLDNVLQKVHEDAPVEDLVLDLQQVLHQTALDCDDRAGRPRGPTKRKTKWDPSFKPLVADLKLKYWEKRNATETDSYLAATIAHKKSKKALRSTQRQVLAAAREQAFQEIMDAAETDKTLFYKLVKKQRKTDVGSAQQMMFDGELVRGPDLPDAWANYFEDLATPTDYPEFDKEHYDSVMLQVNLTATVNLLTEDLIQQITPSDIHTVVQKLKLGKASDLFQAVWTGKRTSKVRTPEDQ